MNILHVTNDIGETDILRREFRDIDSGLRVECAGTASEAIERLEAGASQIDAVLVELTHMNGEGLSLVSEIRKHNFPVGIVAVTSTRGDDQSREALNGGADHVVDKGAQFLTQLPSVLAHATERRTREARLRVMLETAPVPLMRVTGEGTILAMNIATLALIDAERADQVVDQSWSERVVPDTQAACRDFIERAAHGERGSLECEIEGLSGTHRWVLMHAVSAPVDASGVPSALVTFRDLDRTRGLEAGLQQYRQRLKAQERAQSEVEAQQQQLVADHEAERAEWQRQSSTDLTAERAAWEQTEATHRQRLVEEHEAERTEWQQRSSTDPASERAAREQAETDRRALVDQQMLNDALDRTLAAREAECRQLTADHEAERAEWRRQLAAAQAQQAHETSPSDRAPSERENGGGHGGD